MAKNASPSTRPSRRTLINIQKTLNPTPQYQRMPWPELTLWNLNIQFILFDCWKVLGVEQKFQRYNNHLENSNYSFTKSLEVFTVKDNEAHLAKAYWESLHRIHGVEVVERKMIEDWLKYTESLKLNTTQMFEKLSTLFQNSPIEKEKEMKWAGKFYLNRNTTLRWPAPINSFTKTLEIFNTAEKQRHYRSLLETLAQIHGIGVIEQKYSVNG